MVIGKDGGMILVSPDTVPQANYIHPVRLRFTKDENNGR